MDDRRAVDEPGSAGDGLPDDDPTAPDPEATAQTRELLAEHVPLTLLVDLMAPATADSEALVDDEGLPDEEWWAEPDASQE